MEGRAFVYWSAMTVSVLGASVPLAPYGSQIYPELPAALGRKARRRAAL